MRFGRVDGFAWSLTAFIVVLCLLIAIGLQFSHQPRFHTPVAGRGDWADKIGAFWLICCVFGPLLGWITTAFVPLTPDSWRWLYLIRFALAAGAPLITALPMIRYLRGDSIKIGLPILIIVTLLPMLTVIDVGQDLVQGPVIRWSSFSNGKASQQYLQHTQQALEP
jgi:MFS family permease